MRFMPQKPKSRGRYFWFSYQATPGDRRVDQKLHAKNSIPLSHTLGIHMVRCGAAFAELGATIQQNGYSYGGLILNIPRHRDGDWNPTGALHDNYAGGDLSSTDLLVLPTRPPLDDDPSDVKAISRSGTDLEQHVLGSLNCFFAHCNRSSVRLSDALRGKLPQDQRHMHDLDFGQRGTASLLHNDKTIGFLVFQPTVPLHQKPKRPQGPALLAAFGMGGTETLMWTNWLRLNASELIATILGHRERYFIMAQFKAPDCQEIPSTMSFAGFDVTYILNTSF